MNTETPTVWPGVVMKTPSMLAAITNQPGWILLVTGTISSLGATRRVVDPAFPSTPQMGRPKEEHRREASARCPEIRRLALIKSRGRQQYGAIVGVEANVGLQGLTRCIGVDDALARRSELLAPRNPLQ